MGRDTGEDGSEAVAHRHTLAPVPESARVARQVVADVLGHVGRPDLADTASLLVSELVTNAIVHARTRIELDVVARRDGVHVAVRDESRLPPAPRHYGRSATTGRGLSMVEQMADRHGTDLVPGNGKAVWFELGRPPVARPSRPRTELPARREAPATGVVRVRLQSVPTVFALAWQQHADTLLREYLLARWEEHRQLPAAPADVAAAHDAFAALAAAFEPLAEERHPPAYADVSLDVTLRAVPGFADLDRVLEHILSLAESGHTLAPPTQPEIRSFRRWLCGQVQEQAAGAAPTAWGGLPSDLPAARVPAVDWDPQEVTTATAAVLAADDLNRIVAASPAALELLGWDESLIGRRVVTVIPHRYRERHIGAFTLNLLTGEGRIIGRDVAVPALRRDGTEVDVTLHVTGHGTRDGRKVFLARLSPTR